MGVYVPRKNERPEGLRDRLVKEWVKEYNPSIGERTAYWAGYFRGVAVEVQRNFFFKKCYRKCGKCKEL